MQVNKHNLNFSIGNTAKPRVLKPAVFSKEHRV